MKRLVNIFLFIFLFLSMLFASERNKVCIIGGTGSVGAYFANQCVLSKDVETTIIGREKSSHLESIVQNGLTIVTSSGINLMRCFATSRFYDVAPNSQNIIFITLKYPHITEKIAEGIKFIGTKDVLICIICNGLPFYFSNDIEINRDLMHAFSGLKLVHLSPVIAAEILRMGVVRINRPLEKILVNIAPIQNCTHQDMEKLSRFFETTHINRVLKNDFRLLILEKLKFSLSVSLVCVLENKPIDQVFDGLDNQDFISYCIDVINAIGREFNVHGMCTYDEFKKMLITKGHFPSVYHDIEGKKVHEVDVILANTMKCIEWINKKNNALIIDSGGLFRLYHDLAGRLNRSKI